MTFSRRDTILIAVMMNVGLLAILFLTALSDDDSTPISSQTPALIEESLIQSSPIELKSTAQKDEVDAALEQAKLPVQIASSEPKQKAPSLIKEVKVQEEAIELPQSSDPETIEITVKYGDALEKIARANGTSVEKLRKLNHLTSDFLRVGQVLRVPVATENGADLSKKEQPTEGVWYEVQMGDNPWKIARKFQVRYFDILRLNDLNEETARNLRPGDRVRVK